MKKRKFLYMIMAGVIASFGAVAQIPVDDLEEALEELTLQTDEEIEEDSKFRVLRDYMEHPLDLNSATAEDLKAFFFLNELQIHAFLQYRKLLGRLVSLYELQAVPQWDLKAIYAILPYVSVEAKGVLASGYSLADLWEQGAFSGMIRYRRVLEKQRGCRAQAPDGKPKYLGDPNAVFVRAQYKMPQQFSLGFTAERDAGEPFSGYGQSGFDFYSFHFFIKNRGLIKSLALGDYRINFGQGLVNQQGLSFGKTGMVMMVDRSEEKISPHTSAMEYGFYRGMAVTVGKDRWDATFFISGKPEDAVLNAGRDSLYFYFQNFQNTGYHRTEAELSHKGAVDKRSAGSNLQYDFGKGHLGLNVAYHHFSDSMKRGSQPYQLFNPEGKDLLSASLDYALFLNKFYFFGETASDKAGKLATVNGMLMSVNKDIDVSMVYRNYAPGYTALHAKGFGESSKPQNESGFYLGTTVRPWPGWELNAYADFFKSNWLRYRVDNPSTGKDYFVQLNYVPSKVFKVYARYRYKVKPLNTLSGNPMADIENTGRQNLRLFMEEKLSDFITIRSQMEGVLFRNGNGPREKGALIYQNLAWKTNKKISGNARLAYFNTRDYDTRIYTFENNVRYTYYVPSFFGKGLRSYLNFRYNIRRRLSLWTRIAQTRYFDRTVIGTGWDEISGNKKTEFTVQLIWE